MGDKQVAGAVFDLPEDIAKELLSKPLPPGDVIDAPKKVFSILCSLYTSDPDIWSEGAQLFTLRKQFMLMNGVLWSIAVQDSLF